MILTRFPNPPGSVQVALDLLDVVRRGNPTELAQLGDVGDLPRPWDPGTCPDELREAVWGWCDDVAAWLNQHYAWRPTQLIPPCWVQHPHIASELPVLAFGRLIAGRALNPELMEEWHRYSLPMFTDRMFTRLGESTCRTGKHIDWPARGRYAAFTGPEATEDRQRVIFHDTHPGTPLRPVRRA